MADRRPADGSSPSSGATSIGAVKIPDLCPERWLAYLVALAVTAAASWGTSRTERLWALVVVGTAVVVTEGVASAVTRYGRSRHLTGVVLEAVPGRTPAGPRSPDAA